MKQLLSLITAAVVLATAGHGVAASSVDVNVAGSITPAACTPMLGSGGVVDHGKISAKDLSFNVPTALPVATLALRVDCVGSTLVAVKSRDNRAGSSAENPIARPNFGLGLVNGDKKIGWFLLKMSNGQADGVSRHLIESSNGLTWTDASHPDLVWQVGDMRALGGSGSDTAPLPVQSMTIDIQVETMLAQKQDLPYQAEFPIDGSATLEVIYL